MKRALLILFGLFISSFVYAETIAITNAKIYTMSGPVIEKGTVIIQDGKIQEVGAQVAVPQGARVIDGTGKVVLPGFIDANCHVGLSEIDLVDATVDASESTDPITPQMQVTDAFFPDSAVIGVTRSNGVTTAIIAPSDVNVISGLSAVISFSGKQINQIVLKPHAALNVTLGEAPKDQYGTKNKMPQTRMGTAALLRETFQKAKEYGEKWKQPEEKKDAKKKSQEKDTSLPDRDMRLDAVLEVLNGKIPLVASAHRVDDILTIIRIAEEFGVEKNLVINHGTDAYKIADVLARKKIPVIVGPVTTQPDRMETLGAIYENAAKLTQAGVLIAIQTNETHNSRNLPYEAGLAVANGLPYEEALKAITINAAKIFQMQDQIGSIEKGKRADLIVADGDPLEPRTAVSHVFIGGQEMPEANYQKNLWENFQKSRQ